MAKKARVLVTLDGSVPEAAERARLEETCRKRASEILGRADGRRLLEALLP